MRRDEDGNLVFKNLTEWKDNTRYTDTRISTSKSQADIQRLLIDEYGADQVFITERRGGQLGVAFSWNGRNYVIPVRRARIERESTQLIARLQKQAMRVLYWYLKSLLEIRFLTLEGELFLPHLLLETPNGNIRASEAILGGYLRPALPPGRKEEE